MIKKTLNEAREISLSCGECSASVSIFACHRKKLSFPKTCGVCGAEQNSELLAFTQKLLDFCREHKQMKSALNITFIERQ